MAITKNSKSSTAVDSTSSMHSNSSSLSDSFKAALFSSRLVLYLLPTHPRQDIRRILNSPDPIGPLLVVLLLGFLTMLNFIFAFGKLDFVVASSLEEQCHSYSARLQ